MQTDREWDGASQGRADALGRSIERRLVTDDAVEPHRQAGAIALHLARRVEQHAHRPRRLEERRQRGVELELRLKEVGNRAARGAERSDHRVEHAR